MKTKQRSTEDVGLGVGHPQLLEQRRGSAYPWTRMDPPAPSSWTYKEIAPLWLLLHMAGPGAPRAPTILLGQLLLNNGVCGKTIEFHVHKPVAALPLLKNCLSQKKCEGNYDGK